MTIYVNDCFIQYIVLGGVYAAGIATLISALCSPCIPFAVVIGAYIAIEIGFIVWADNTCGSRGAYINHPWVGPNWVARVC